MKCKLHSFEVSACIVWWILANVFSIFKLYESQTELFEKVPAIVGELNDLQPGWSIIGRVKDISDVEWSSWKYFIHISWPYFIVQFVITEIIRQTKLSQLAYWYVASSTTFIVFHFGFKHLLLTIIQPMLYAAVIFNGGEKFSIWVVSILSLLCYNFIKYRPYLWIFLDHENLFDEEIYLLLFAFPWIGLRCISFCSNFVDKKEKDFADKPSKMITLLSIISYSLYLPLLYTGPVILYEDFEKSLAKPSENVPTKLRTFFWDIGIFMIYLLLLDLTMHFIYFYAMQSNMELIRMLPTIALCGGGLWMGVEFHIKYVIAYGVASAYGRLDNIEMPPTPRCIARVHVYSQMWRYFDVGLYKFLIKYIYKPSFEAITANCRLPKIMNKMIASLSTFIFVCLWHGTIKHIYVWSALNYLGVTLEYLSKAVSETEQYKWFKKRILRSEAMETRFIAVICVPMLMVSAISNFYLFAGSDVGNLYFEYFLNPSFLGWNSLLVSLSLYCCCISSMALEDIPSRTDVKKLM